MIKHGLNPDQVINELKGAAPSSFIMKRVMEAWQRKNQLELTNADEDA